MLRVAIVGCGKIADQHVHAIRRVADCEIVAVCDQELLMARQLAERFAIRGCFDDAEEMLRTSRPNVVHITTPPQSHALLARLCVDSGSHVYLEKPFTVTALEARQVIDHATKEGLVVTAGHNYQFVPEMIRMRSLVAEGFLGGQAVHVESHWSYDLGDASYVGPLLGNRNHWVRRLPGQLLHNLISHGIARIVEFLDGDITEVLVSGHQSRQLRELGGEEVVDELRVLLRDTLGTTALFCFSTQIKPGMNSLRVFGPKNTLVIDLASGTLTKLPGRSYKSYLTFVVPPLVAAMASTKQAMRNLWEILRWRLHQDSGMKALIESFYSAILVGGPPPIPYGQIIATADVMDRVFAQLQRDVSADAPAETEEQQEARR